MDPKFFVGVDISKVTIDVAIVSNNIVITNFKTENSEPAIKELLLKLKADYHINRLNTLFCAEAMGIYATFLLAVLGKNKMPVCMESPLQIKRSIGIARGKTDLLDACRIAIYASKHYKVLRLWEEPRPCISHLKSLMAIRRRLIKARVMLKNSKKTNAYYLNKLENSYVTNLTKMSLAGLSADVKELEMQMLSTVKSDAHLQKIFEILNSIPHIGKIISLHLITATNEFKDFSNPKKFACYCGIAPFEWSSGTSLNGKKRISRLANKELKTLLHLASIGYTRRKKSMLGKFYLKKVQEGKNKMSILNAIRNKLVHRIFACVRDNKMFEESL
ncbi:IS110 family transposase [Chitinophaga sp. MM2321]|uniref:IS110 family transposase n=1 Tax=Chitinophaga sp. MM2321 TaxID=3137178 RepID=UPI0032D5A4EB